jgi:hypothetical protein
LRLRRGRRGTLRRGLRTTFRRSLLTLNLPGDGVTLELGHKSPIQPRKHRFVQGGPDASERPSHTVYVPHCLRGAYQILCGLELALDDLTATRIRSVDRTQTPLNLRHLSDRFPIRALRVRSPHAARHRVDRSDRIPAWTA